MDLNDHILVNLHDTKTAQIFLGGFLIHWDSSPLSHQQLFGCGLTICSNTHKVKSCAVI